MLALGAGQWCSMRPMPSVRVWTLYVDEAFLRAQMSWVLLDARRVVRGAHPDEWDGSALVLTPGIEALQCCEPLWRQISLMDQTTTPELTATRMIRLFSRAIEYTLPALLVEPNGETTSAYPRGSFPVKGTLTQPPLAPQVRRSTDLLRVKMAEPWTVHRLAAEVAMSRTHLTRLFSMQVGVAPMRFLTEVRLTEFTRLIEETRMSVASAAQSVGWADSRVAAGWFRRRFGIGPSEYRRHPHPTCIGDMPCDWCHGDCPKPGQPVRPMRPTTRVLQRDAQIRPNP
ncbi:MAG: helix-turn-helix transcriptional regulator [Microbacterium sp.]|nr:helix-turn-helix transcriptional regulator [Microbacterium sp.]